MRFPLMHFMIPTNGATVYRLEPVDPRKGDDPQP